MFYGTYDVKVKNNSIDIPFDTGSGKSRMYCMKDVENIVFVQIWREEDIKKAEEFVKDFEVLSFSEENLQDKKIIIPEEFSRYLGEEKNVRISGVIDYIDIIKESDFKELSDEEIDKLLDF